ncbi:unnamed protein product [Caenorhabditis brenneri]
MDFSLLIISNLTIFRQQLDQNNTLSLHPTASRNTKTPEKKIERNKLSIRNSIEAQIREYEKEIPGQSTKEPMLNICVKEQQEQEDKLETVSQKLAEYKGNAVQGAKTVNTVIRNADLYREDSPLKNILLKLFWKESNSTREWRQALRDESYHSGHQDVREIFEVLIEDLCKDINLNPMKFETTSETKCKFCGHSEKSTTIQHFGILNLTRHETFKKLLAEEYGSQPLSKCSCGGATVESNVEKDCYKY